MSSLRALILTTSAFAAGLLAAPLWAQAPRDMDQACAAVAHLALPDTRITDAEAIHPQPQYLVPETAHVAPGPFGGPVRVSRPFCRVGGVVAPAIRFEVWLPLANWSGRFEGLGLGAFLGAIPYAQMAAAVAQGYAVASTDTGHESGGMNADWAMTSAGQLNTETVNDWAHRGMHEMSLKSEAVVRAFYGQAARYRYFVGCSSGGHQALTEAQRYPNDYDGIVAGAPANYWTHLMAGQLWYGLATRVDPASNLEMPINKLALIHQAALRACDEQDGVRDGLIENPLACRFDPQTLACHSGEREDECLTAAQVQALRKIYGVANDGDGHEIFPGLAPGSELGWRGMSAAQVAFAQTFYRYLVFQNPNWNYASMQFGRDVAYADQRVGAITNSTNPDLRPFRDHGGKLLQYAGWSDPLISPYNSVNYYRSVAHALDADQPDQAALADVQGFYRLFMVPGMGHCRGGGTDTFDALSALQDWVEQGKAPDHIQAAKLADGRVVRTRPLCPFPRVARYQGQGSTDVASNFKCELPRRS